MVFVSFAHHVAAGAASILSFRASKTIVFEARKYESKISRGWAWNPRYQPKAVNRPVPRLKSSDMVLLR